MTESGWLLLCLAVGFLAVVGWVERELWIARRRARRRYGKS